jgi:hypothetical protein
MSHILICYALWHYAECHYAECPSAKCRGAPVNKETINTASFYSYFVKMVPSLLAKRHFDKRQYDKIFKEYTDGIP